MCDYIVKEISRELNIRGEERNDKQSKQQQTKCLYQTRQLNYYNSCLSTQDIIHKAVTGLHNGHHLL